MFKVKTLNKISKIGLDLLDKTNFAVEDDNENPDAILVRSAVMHDMELPCNLKAIARAGAGTNNIPLDKCAEKGIVVFNTPGANANAVKELSIAALMLASRDIVEAVKWTSSIKGEGDAVAKLAEKNKSQFAGIEVKGKTLGVIGLGAIGALVANAAVELGMNVIGCDPYISIDGAWRLSRNVHKALSNDEIFAKADFIALHVPSTPETKNLVNKDSIAKMKDGVRILNFARGDLVNNADLIEAVASGKIAKYVTDFIADELIDVKNIITIPHLGASTEESEDNCAVMAVNEITDYLMDGNIVNSVNMPNTFMARTPDHERICVIHKNQPQMVSAITNAVAPLNIENMMNKSRGDYAYTLLDVNGNADDIADNIKNIADVINVRVIK